MSTPSGDLSLEELASVMMSSARLARQMRSFSLHERVQSYPVDISPRAHYADPQHSSNEEQSVDICFKLLKKTAMAFVSSEN